MTSYLVNNGAKSILAADSDMDASILIVDDDPGIIEVMGRILVDVGELRFATSGRDALRLVRESSPDLILLDGEMPGMTGFQLFEMLKKEPQLSEVPVIFVTSHSETGFEVSALEMGASDFIAKPFVSSLVVARVRTHLRAKRMADKLRRISTTDNLTGVVNRVEFDKLLEREWQRGKRASDPMSLLLVDLDHFGLYNNRHGRSAGDVCLQRVASILTGISRRAADVVARCGGEEFMVLLPQTPRSGAAHLARRILESVEEQQIDHGDSPTSRHVTVSVGISCYDEDCASWVSTGSAHRGLSDQRVSCTGTDLVLAADKALHLAKRAGRAQAKMREIGSGIAPESVTGPARLPQTRDEPNGLGA
jgi:diguanylate cyclase (GGDEF)-like protein